MSEETTSGEGSDSQSYFHAVEEAFIRLRGSPLLLSPADWKTAQGWRQRGIPIDFVIRALEEVFERRRERGSSAKVNGLRYCAQHVESSWSEVAELLAPGRRADEAGNDMGVEEVLQRLAAGLPSDWPECEALAVAVRSLEGSREEVERALTTLDDELLRVAEARLDAEERQLIAQRVETRLRRLADRLDCDQRQIVRRRLELQEIRARQALPVLSLFAEPQRPGG